MHTLFGIPDFEDFGLCFFFLTVLWKFLEVCTLKHDGCGSTGYPDKLQGKKQKQKNPPQPKEVC